MDLITTHSATSTTYVYVYKICKKSNLRKEVGTAMKSKETSSQLRPVRNTYVAVLHQPVTVSSKFTYLVCLLFIEY